ncbi:hypothetical protein LT493_00780 [Streptomyces tricolor]|nr:hypothetical protein [Streptomyces tricolor]
MYRAMDAYRRIFGDSSRRAGRQRRSAPTPRSTPGCAGWSTPRSRRGAWRRAASTRIEEIVQSLLDACPAT